MQVKCSKCGQIYWEGVAHNCGYLGSTILTNPPIVNPFPISNQPKTDTRNYKCGKCHSEFNYTQEGNCPFCGFGKKKKVKKK